MKSSFATAALAVFLVLFTSVQAARLGDDPPAVPTIRITSPLGRTGVSTKVRIVAQVHAAPNDVLSVLSFYVDGKLVGRADLSPYAAVDWLDENPFEKREIIVEAADATGRLIKDTVLLPAFEVNDKTEVTSILLETGVYDKTGRFISNL